jgi:hypothetical protein
MPDLLIADISVVFIGPVRTFGRRQNLFCNAQQPADRRIRRPGCRAFLHMDVKRGADRCIYRTAFRDPKFSVPLT